MGWLCSGLLFPVSCLVLLQVASSGLFRMPCGERKRVEARRSGGRSGVEEMRGSGSLWEVDLRTDWN
ncbi:interleukin 4 receptor [Homo sapiens]|uniref:IL4R nirs variant 1 n=1 Tax=Homo sapiens TaxID=9606 RepID=Q5FC08_HUMAN|nr:interleukin 4 receptor [Homo sapiens]KAI2577761.1 interleukin 4 receptor [Homo sapiens]KAI2577762.1 interleukin 4 receptor [Homo sapiens]KAI4054171.1 interleukin 4 receptor [Homo sapiens]KAI4054172.1 interleukin 4 receptor [Homo sapiens]